MRLLSIAMIIAGLSLVGCTKCGQEAPPPAPEATQAAPAPETAPAQPAQGVEGQTAGENSDLETPGDEPMPEEKMEVEGQ